MKKNAAELRQAGDGHRQSPPSPFLPRSRKIQGKQKEEELTASMFVMGILLSKSNDSKNTNIADGSTES